MFTFCFIRNSYWRCISWYEFHKNIEPYASLTFKEWVEHGMPHHWKQQNQTDYEKEKLTPLLQYTFTRDCKIDFIGRIENFYNDLRHVVNKLNTICTDKELKHRFHFNKRKLNNIKRTAGIDEYYTDEIKEMVYGTLKEDFFQFDYDR